MEKALLGLFPFPIVSINQKQVHFTVLIIIGIFLLIIIFPPVPSILIKDKQPFYLMPCSG